MIYLSVKWINIYKRMINSFTHLTNINNLRWVSTLLGIEDKIANKVEVVSFLSFSKGKVKTQTQMNNIFASFL